MMKPEEITTYGSWVKDRVLGVGGFGVVTLWRKQDEYIALKKCRWENVSFDQVTAKQRERWTLEVSIMKRLSHPNVVSFVQLPGDFASMKSELPVLSMEYCSLGDLRQVNLQNSLEIYLPNID
ncbi:inhibitor of nuclear factor kappa-B kinase subunit beta-like [Nilaparvata lugens]|uniref:inhibitor of nuclear factor kappa-B kinase subunit beta-like n=1 Tax=Nilaparvata lugens TaxID=108931 RepID=UPI00193E4A4B|nr:inhibitor of nuclear factor kappa-B kinase subunit beta-like [Nilaparvata lugens]XP_039293625.1 inhibitor of nuclear factor kappa-B kinase subunit beta-like [Nilaparvata lugens]XP_039293626.1 inhibitor of nuclear factor kappa-B kinase subunit beta-like [Nilaparvata lugens]XP_039293627.1 inhibitor of nuclear factor kappa-B kinase subunit beta-like [Nilaparvata lugens]XP_039293628.1 inhibitor of nuclear factor kappa-B kinase subunit beta-like [Nilaparvata lugens]XP_039293629.1 inhibitor of nu